VGKSKHAAQKVVNALILLNCDQSQGGDDRRTSQEIAQVLQVSERKIDRAKRRFVQDGLEVARRLAFILGVTTKMWSSVTGCNTPSRSAYYSCKRLVNNVRTTSASTSLRWAQPVY